MNIPWLVARRYLRPRRFSVISVIGAVSIIGIIIGTAALVIVMSLFNGLQGVAQKLMIGFGPHIQIQAASGSTLRNADKLEQSLQKTFSTAFASDAFAIQPTYRSQLVLRAGERTGVALGVGIYNSESPVFDGPRRATILGTFLANSTDPSIVVASGVAEHLQLYLGDTVTLISPAMLERSISSMFMPAGVQVVVSGIFQSNTARDVDQIYAYLPASLLRSLTKQDAPSTIDINFSDVNAIDQATELIAPSPDYTVLTWRDLNKSLVQTMKLEGMGSFIVLALIVVVASFSVLVSLTLGVIEKRRDIALLLTLGLQPSDIKRLYVMQGLTLGVVSVALGIIIGLAVCWGQQTFHWIAFDMTRGYLVPALPVEIHGTDVIIVAVTGLVLAGTAALYPAARASKTVIADAIRVE